MSISFIIYKFLFYISYLGNPIILLLTYLSLFMLKVMEEVNDKVYLPKKNLTIYIGFYSLFVFWLPHYAHKAKDTMYRESIIEMLQTPQDLKIYVNNTQITNEYELTKIIRVLKKIKYIAPHHSQTTKNKIKIFIKEKKGLLTLTLSQDSIRTSEYWVYGQFENEEKIIYYGKFAGVVDTGGVLTKYIQIENKKE